jgi:hypothetical protein
VKYSKAQTHSAQQVSTTAGSVLYMGSSKNTPSYMSTVVV